MNDLKEWGTTEGATTKHYDLQIKKEFYKGVMHRNQEIAMGTENDT